MVQEAAYKRGRPEDGDDQPSPKRQAAENGTAADGSEEQEEYEVDSDDNEEEDSSDVDQEYAWLRAQLRADGAAGESDEEEEEDDWSDPTGGPLSALLEAAGAGDEQAVRDLLKDHTDLDITLPGPDGDTALHVACLFGNLEVALVLVEHGKEAAVTNVNQQDGSTPLHDAAASGHVEIAELLLKAGAAVNAADNDGDTPLHNAARGGETDVVALLLKNGADPSLRNSAGNTPLQETDEDAIRQLLESKQNGAAH